MSVDKLVEKSSNLDNASRQILFDYIKNGEYIMQHRFKLRVLVNKSSIDMIELEKIHRSARKIFISKAMLIFSSFLEYGFINRRQEKSGGGFLGMGKIN